MMGCPSYKYANQERYLVKFAKKCSKKGYKFFLIYENDPTSKEFIEDIKAAGGTLIRITPKRWILSNIDFHPLHVLVRPFSELWDLHALLAVNRIIRNNDIDIVHSYFTPSLYSIFMGTLMDKVTIKTSGNPIITPFQRMTDQVTPALMFYCAVRHRLSTLFLNKIHCVSKTIYDGYREFNINEEKLELIYSGTDPEYFCKDGVDGSDIRDEFGLEKNDFTIGFTGRLERQKNLFFLMDVFRGIWQKIPDARFIVVGDGSKMNDLKKRCVELGIGERVIFTGRRNDIREILVNIDLFMMASIFEGLPGSLLEAMSMEKPCIVSDIDAFREITRNGENGFCCELGDVEDFVSTTVMLYKDPEKRRILGEEARQDILDKYNLDLRVDRTIAVYDKLMKKEN